MGGGAPIKLHPIAYRVCKALQTPRQVKRIVRKKAPEQNAPVMSGFCKSTSRFCKDAAYLLIPCPLMLESKLLYPHSYLSSRSPILGGDIA